MKTTACKFFLLNGEWHVQFVFGIKPTADGVTKRLHITPLPAFEPPMWLRGEPVYEGTVKYLPASEGDPEVVSYKVKPPLAQTSLKKLALKQKLAGVVHEAQVEAKDEAFEKKKLKQQVMAVGTPHPYGESPVSKVFKAWQDYVKVAKTTGVEPVVWDAYLAPDPVCEFAGAPHNGDGKPVLTPKAKETLEKFGFVLKDEA
jgi:hypothetical protein